MKQNIPVPVVVIGIALVCILAGFAFYKMMSGPPEFEAPKTSKTIPKYVWDGMSPEMKSKMKGEGYSPGDVQQGGQHQRPESGR